MNQTEFQALVKDRQEWADSSRKNKFNFEPILAGLYPDVSHFIYEILQNAEDEGAKTVTFTLFPDKIEIWHDGEDFDFQDVEGITGIGEGTKAHDLNKIGKFGVGFKSVYAITRRPHIQSGDFHFHIEDLVVPKPVHDDASIVGTKITLPFEHPKRSQSEIYDLVKKRLGNIGLTSLLFLKNIQEIKWEADSDEGHHLCERKSAQYANVTRVVLVSQSSSEEYLVLERPVQIEDADLKVEIAYRIGQDDSKQERIVAAEDSRLFAFFATEKITFLRFLMQGPYKTTPARDNIPLEDKDNTKLIQETARLVADSLSTIKELGLLDVDFLNLLPIKKEEPAAKDPIYSEIYSQVLTKLRSEPLLPTADGVFASASDVLLARGRDLTDLLSPEDIKLLFGRSKWLDASITRDRMPDLRGYLVSQLGVQEVDFESFAAKLTSELLSSKSDDWMIEFYTLLQDQPSLWKYSSSSLRTKPFIRTKDDSHIAPFKPDGKTVQVYLPTSATTQYQTVKQSIVQNENCLSFFKELGLHDPEVFDEINEFIIPKYASTIIGQQVDESYYSDFGKLLTAFGAPRQRHELIPLLRDLTFILSRNPVTQQTQLRMAGQVYLPAEDLEGYFRDNDTVHFVAGELYERFEKESLERFLKAISVEDKLRRIRFDGNLTLERKRELRKQSPRKDDGYRNGSEQISDYHLDGLDWCLSRISDRISILIWRQLLCELKELTPTQIDAFFQGEYSWYHHSPRKNYFDAQFIVALRSSRWLLTQQGELKSPQEMTATELANCYERESREARDLIEKLQFKPDIEQQYFQQLPEDERHAHLLIKEAMKRGISISELEQLLKLKENEGATEEKWKAEYSPDEVAVQIETYAAKPEDHVRDDQTLHLRVEDDDTVTEDTRDTPPEKPETKSTINVDDIGRWGETYVFEALKHEYENTGKLETTDFGFKLTSEDDKVIEVYWLNLHSNRGKGYDFVVKVDGNAVRYIEVKAKTSEQPELVSVTGEQWRSARAKGDTYWIYVVSGAGSKDSKITQIQNPVELWREGKLYADPVNVKL